MERHRQFERLIRRTIRTYASRHRAWYDDIEQECRIALWRAEARGSNASAIRVILNCVQDWVAKREAIKRGPETVGLFDKDVLWTAAPSVGPTILSAVERLGGTRRNIVCLWLRGLSISAIARSLDVSRQRVWHLWQTSLTMLRTTIGEHPCAA